MQSEERGEAREVTMSLPVLNSVGFITQLLLNAEQQETIGGFRGWRGGQWVTRVDRKRQVGSYFNSQGN